MITPVVQEGTPLNKKTLEDLDDSIRDYQVATCTAVDISEATTSTILGQLNEDTTDGGTVLSGYCKGNKDGKKWGFAMSASLKFSFDTGAKSNEMALSVVKRSNGKSYTAVSYMNEALYNSSTDPTYYLDANPGTDDNSLTYTWDLLEQRTCKIYYYVTQMLGTITCQGRNDDTAWATISTYTITSSTAESSRQRTVISSTPYRYYRVMLTITNYYARIYYLYLGDVPDVELKYRNAYTIPQKLREYEVAHYKIYAQHNSTTVNRMEYVTENTLNGAPIDRILYPRQLYDLRGNNTSLTTCAGTFTVKKYEVSSKSTVTFPSEPKFIIVIQTLTDPVITYIGTARWLTYTVEYQSTIYAFF